MIKKFKDINLPVDERVASLLNELTLDEKLTLLPTRMAAVERLGIGEWKVGAEAAHGVVRHEQGEKTTVFPQPMGFSSTWNPELLEQIGEKVGIEARLIHQQVKNQMLTVWSPTVDLERDPRWGRTEEAYGEDPCLTGVLSAAYCRGLSGKHDKYYRVIPALKHFYANNNEEKRASCSATIPPREKYEYYLKAFEPAIKDKSALSVMTAYNEINGTPCLFMKDTSDILLKDWELLFYVSDGADFSQTLTSHKYVKDHAQAFALTLKAGCSSFNDPADVVISAGKLAFERGLVNEQDVDKALFGILKARFLLGEFDPDENNPYSSYSKDLLCCEEHGKLSLQAAKESIVLLKNNNSILPISKESSVAVIGPLADIVYKDWYTGLAPYEISPLKGIENLSKGKITYASGNDKIIFKNRVDGGYIGLNKQNNSLRPNLYKQDETSIFELTDFGWGSKTLKNTYNNKFVSSSNGRLEANADAVWGWFVMQKLGINYKQGHYSITDWWGNEAKCENEQIIMAAPGNLDNNKQFDISVTENGIAEAVKIAKKSDYAVVVVGNHPLINGKEDFDRADIIIPPAQEALIKAVYEANKNTIVMIVSSYPMSSEFVYNNIPAVTYCSHSGQELGNALASVLYGDYSPSGKLSMTWYKNISQLPSIFDYDIIKKQTTYMYMNSKPQYPFGHGLSYCNFEYSDLRTDKGSYTESDKVKVTLKVKNNGMMKAQNVIQIYTSLNQNSSKIKRANKQLKAFKKIELEPEEIQTVELEINIKDFAVWDVRSSKYVVETGTYLIEAAQSSADTVLKTKLHIKAGEIADRDMNDVIQAMNCDDYDKLELGECCLDGGVAVTNHKGVLVYKDCIFSGQNKLKMLCSNVNTTGKISIHIDKIKSKPAFELDIAPTCGAQIWQEFTAEFDEINGKHDIYMQFSYWGVNVKEFKFYK